MPATAPLLWLPVLIALLSLGGCPPSPAATDVATPPADDESTLTAHFFDVGQGDATLLMGPDFTILVDAGRHDREDVVDHLEAADVDTIDLLIGTHVHADHIGQFPNVLDAFAVTEVWLSGDEHTTRTFERTLDAIEASDAGYHEPRAGEVEQIGAARVEVVNPAALTGDLHEGCIAVRIVFGDVAYMLTGDAEAHTERAMIDRDHDLQAQVLQLGHHGSSTSTSREWLEAVEPGVAIYSAEADSRYGHPHDETVARLGELDIPLYGTAEHGTITVTTDGATYEIATERGEPAEDGADCGPGRVNVNTATADELTRIVHIGPERAEQLIDLRPFKSLGDLTRINGIGPARLRDIREQGVACVE